jgi:predicted glycosyltransferase
LQVVDDPIQELLEYVGRVYVTYSGVGVEAARLGIPTTLVHIPGRISWSKLLDYQGNELNQTNVVLGSEGGQR